MKLIRFALIAIASMIALLASPVLGSGDPVKDTRQILAGTVAAGQKAYLDYLAGRKDATPAFQGALKAYKTVRAAEVPPVIAPPPVVQPPIGPVGEAAFDAAPALAAVASNFDVTAALIPSWGTGQIAPSEPAIPGAVGAFRFICGAGQLLKDDPIVSPGQPGVAHLHQFFGNLGANAASTYATLRGAGGSSCEGGGPIALNRSAYWMPAMLDGQGNAVQPDFVSVYYKRFRLADPGCKPIAQGGVGECAPLPNGLRFIAGYDMVTGTPKTGKAYFKCDGQTASGDHFEDFTEAKVHCPTAINPDGSRNRIGAVIIMPECWDGINLDSPNHRSHVSYTQPRADGSGNNSCPATHPKLLPTFTMGVWYTVDANLGTWSLSSDAMHPELAVGSTFHADWFGAWDNGVEAQWMDNCINKLLSCSGGDLGNGKQIKNAQQPSYGWLNPNRLVPIP